MKGVVLCEYSGVVSSAFRAIGIDCWSCDILPTEGDPAWHIQHDAIEVAYGLDRARFEPGFAFAMAKQWGTFLRAGYDL